MATVSNVSVSVSDAAVPPATGPWKLPKYIPQLDGLRGIAILLVLWAHSWEAFYVSDKKFGWIGVDLFFVLSGFLITGILVDAKETSHYFRNFYVRRGLRIWPLYYVVLALIFAMAPHLTGRHRFSTTTYPPAYYVFYLQNLFIPMEGQPGPLAITWSLAIEEQFYLIWPFLIRLFRPKALRNLLIAIVLIDPFYRWFLIQLGGDAHIHTLARLDQLAMGSLLALFVRSESFSLINLRRTGLVLVPLLPIIMVVLKVFGSPPYEVLFTVVGLGFAGLLALALTSPRESLLFRGLDNRFLRYTGKISYGIYLFHAVCFSAFRVSPMQRVVAQWPMWIQKPVTVLSEWALVYLVATLSWYSFENHILKLKSRFEVRPGSYGLEGAAPVAKSHAIS